METHPVVVIIGRLTRPLYLAATEFDRRMAASSIEAAREEVDSATMRRRAKTAIRTATDEATLHRSA